MCSRFVPFCPVRTARAFTKPSGREGAPLARSISGNQSRAPPLPFAKNEPPGEGPAP